LTQYARPSSRKVTRIPEKTHMENWHLFYNDK
jgi:hypothetical protein